MWIRPTHVPAVMVLGLNFVIGPHVGVFDHGFLCKSQLVYKLVSNTDIAWDSFRAQGNKERKPPSSRSPESLHTYLSFVVTIRSLSRRYFAKNGHSLHWCNSCKSLYSSIACPTHPSHGKAAQVHCAALNLAFLWLVSDWFYNLCSLNNFILPVYFVFPQHDAGWLIDYISSFLTLLALALRFRAHQVRAFQVCKWY